MYVVIRTGPNGKIGEIFSCVTAPELDGSLINI